MIRSKISAALILATAAGVFATMSANAATRHTHKPSFPATAMNSVGPAPSAQTGDWESRNAFYRGPTYIGRY